MSYHQQPSPPYTMLYLSTGFVVVFRFVLFVGLPSLMYAMHVGVGVASIVVTMISDGRDEALYRMATPSDPISSVTLLNTTATTTIVTSPAAAIKIATVGSGKPSTSTTATAAKSGVLFTGGAASMVAAACTHPLDLLKVRLQIEMAKQPASIVSTTARILRTGMLLCSYLSISTYAI
jgi:hypothetical protein